MRSLRSAYYTRNPKNLVFLSPEDREEFLSSVANGPLAFISEKI